MFFDKREVLFVEPPNIIIDKAFNFLIIPSCRAVSTLTGNIVVIVIT